MFPPEDLLGRCDEWLDGEAGGGFFFHPTLGSVSVAGRPTGGDSFACALPFEATQPFALGIRRLLPDADGVTLRSLWASLFVALPVLLALALLLACPASERPPARLGRLLSLAGAAAFLAALS